MVILPSWDPVQLGMGKLCCACHSSSIAALIYIIVVPDTHGQRHCEIKASRLRLSRTEAFFLRFNYSNQIFDRNFYVGDDGRPIWRSMPDLTYCNIPTWRLMKWLNQNTNLVWCGYYLAPAPNRPTSQWMGKYSAVKDKWGVLPVYVGQQDERTGHGSYE